MGLERTPKKRAGDEKGSEGDDDVHFNSTWIHRFQYSNFVPVEYDRKARHDWRQIEKIYRAQQVNHILTTTLKTILQKTGASSNVRGTPLKNLLP